MSTNNNGIVNNHVDTIKKELCKRSGQMKASEEQWMRKHKRYTERNNSDGGDVNSGGDNVTRLMGGMELNEQPHTISNDDSMMTMEKDILIDVFKSNKQEFTYQSLDSSERTRLKSYYLIPESKIGQSSITDSFTTFKDTFKVFTRGMLNTILNNNANNNNNVKMYIGGGTVLACLLPLEPKGLWVAYRRLYWARRALQQYNIPNIIIKEILEWIVCDRDEFNQLIYLEFEAFDIWRNSDIDIFIVYNPPSTLINNSNNNNSNVNNNSVNNDNYNSNNNEMEKEEEEEVEEKEKDKLIQVKREIKRVIGEIVELIPVPYTIIQTLRSITILPLFPYRPIQIITTILGSPLEYLLYTDLDCVSVMYDLTDDRIITVERGQRALNRHCNVLTPKQLSQYQSRQQKYFRRQFSTILVDLDEDNNNNQKNNNNMFGDDDNVDGDDLLLSFTRMYDHIEEFGPSIPYGIHINTLEELLMKIEYKSQYINLITSHKPGDSDLNLDTLHQLDTALDSNVKWKYDIKLNINK